MHYILSDYDFLNAVIGIEDASRTFFNKKSEELSLDEELEIIVILKNSSYYNRIRRPELVSQAVQELKESISKD